MIETTDNHSHLLIRNVHLATSEQTAKASQLFTVQCSDGIVQKVVPEQSDAVDTDNEVDGKGGILLPSLCHSHIHLDKCNILSQCDDLISGTFQEAMTVTAKAKAAFSYKDLHSRGQALILESIKYGATSLRAHVEVDSAVHFKCVEAGLHLKHELKNICDIGIAIFAQEPLYDSSSGHNTSENLRLLREASNFKGISAIGSAPYVESSILRSYQNIDEVLQISLSRHLHVDFHLDYNLSHTSEPLIHYVIKRVRDIGWAEQNSGKRITIGHATRLSLFSSDELLALRKEIGDLPLTFVGLPQSDLYMMGRDDAARPRGTLQVPKLVNCGLDVAMAVNNVGNAFTPQGSLDPLSLCTLGVAVYQTGTPKDCRILLEAVSIVSRRAAGFPTSDTLEISEGNPADFLLVHRNDNIQSVVLNPGYERTVIKEGKVVARRTVNDYVAYSPLV